MGNTFSCGRAMVSTGPFSEKVSATLPRETAATRAPLVMPRGAVLKHGFPC